MAEVSIAAEVSKRVSVLRNVLSALCLLLIALIVCALLIVVGGRVVGLPMTWLTVPQDLGGIGIFLFCAAFAVSR